MWDRFKKWKKDSTEKNICPLCQHINSASAETCSSCSYQLNKPNYKQTSNIEESETNNLFDELMNEFEEEKETEVIDWSKATFKMDDVTVDVNQYSEEDSVILSSKPNFAMASTTIELPSNKEEIEEDYELKPEDAPALSTKFEIPDEKPEELEEPTNEPIALIQPTSGTPDNVQVMEAQNISENIDDIEILQPADFDGDGVVDIYEESFYEEETTIQVIEPIKEPKKEESAVIETSQSEELLPPAPANLPPLLPSKELKSTPVKETIDKEEKIVLPSAPIMPLSDANDALSIPNKQVTYWPWTQQEEWEFPNLKEQVLAAMRAAIDKNIAHATVLIDEVGPHLGNQTNLIYPIGKLLDTIGRPNAVDKMLKSAINSLPGDPNVIQAKQKLRP
jgi:ribosomal protein L40E